MFQPMTQPGPGWAVESSTVSGLSLVTAEAAHSEQPTQVSELFPSKNSRPADFQPQWPALKQGSSDPKVLERPTQTDPVEVGLVSPVAVCSPRPGQ